MGIGLYTAIQILKKINKQNFFKIESHLKKGTRIAFLLIKNSKTLKNV